MAPFFSNSFTSLLLLTGVAISTWGTASALPSAHKHAGRRHADLPVLATPHPAMEERQNTGGGGYRSVAYYVNWAMYTLRNHPPQDLADKAASLTHILYAFANFNPDGTVIMTDSWADSEKHFDGDSWNDPNGNSNLYGCLKQLNLLKQKNRNLKVLLSIGGWTYSENGRFAAPAASAATRATFAKSAVQLVKDYGFDGLDIDWEYPRNKEEGTNWTLLLEAIRKELDTYGNSLPEKYHFELTVACPAGPTNIANMDLPGMDKHLDFWNLMAYDYAGAGFSKVAGHQANLYPAKGGNETGGGTDFSTEAALALYEKEGVALNKIVLGMPLYTRGFGSTAGIGQSFANTPMGDLQETGIYSFKNTPLPGSTETVDEAVGGSYSYDPAQKLLLSYDNKAMSTIKANYIKSKNLGGGMWWETSGDKKGAESLILNVVNTLGGPSALEKKQNCVSYPESKFPNLKAGLTGGGDTPGAPGASGTATGTAAVTVATGANQWNQPNQQW